MIGALALLVGLAGPGAEILATLQAADRARSALAQEANAWQLESQRTEALIQALKAEAARLNARAQQDEGRIDALAAERRSAAADPVGQALAAEARRVAASILTRLAALDLPLAPALPALPDDPAQALEAARAALATREAAASAIDVTITRGTLDGAPRAVQVLRMGHVGLWWRALDGAAAGSARWRDGQLHLEAADEAAAVRIATAIAVAAEQQPPAVVLLPAAHLEIDRP